jgi:type II secretory pathway pseudopilin PulG
MLTDPMLASRRAARAGQAGLTVIEVLVAVLVITVGMLAVLGALMSAGRLTSVGQRQEQLVAYAEGQVEALHGVPFDRLGMRSTVLPPGAGQSGDPSVSGATGPTDPNRYATAGCPAGLLGLGAAPGLKIMADYANPSSTELACEPFAPGDAGTPADPASASGEAVSVAGIDAHLYRYVTVHEPGCVDVSVLGLLHLGLPIRLSSSVGEKRITVAVVPDGRAGDGVGPTAPVWTTTIVADPDAKPLGLGSQPATC